MYLEVPQGRFLLKRFPIRNKELLQAWDAADEYLLQYIDAENVNVSSNVVILNDGFGALALGLNQLRPLSISDSYVSRQAANYNLDLNAVSTDAVQFADSFSLPAAPIDYLLLKIPKTLALLEYQLFSLRPFLHADTKIIAAGMVKNLPASVWRILENLVGPTNTSLAWKKARLIFATYDPSLCLPFNPYPSSYQLENSEFRLWNHANVFSRESLDIGARFFLQHLPDNPAYTDYIDLGCGNGVLGIMLAHRLPHIRMCFVDESDMAIASARQNFTEAFAGRLQAEFKLDDSLSSFSSKSVDCIVCNPPFHQQHAIGEQIAINMFQQAQRVLRAGGELRVIANRHLAYHQSLRKLFGNCQTTASNNKFVIYKCIRD